MTHAIIGANGDMGKNLLVPLLKQHGGVIAVNRNDNEQVWDQAWRADIIWLSVPRDVIPSLLAGKKFLPEQLIIDICSIKRGLSAVIQKTGASHLSLHPLHGPFIPLNGQKWAHIKTGMDLVQHAGARSLIKFLEEKGISFFEAESENEHDFMIGLTLSLPEAVTIFLDTIIDQYAKDAGRATPSMAKLMEWSVPASNALFSYYIHSINSSAEWLRNDLILGAYGDLPSSARQAALRMSQITEDNIVKQLARQHEFIEALSLVEKKRARQWIERWFADSTQKIFSFNQHKSVKPKLTIQEMIDKTNVFPIGENPVKIGIHGIAGSFTHESVLRLAEELGRAVDRLEFHFLVEAKKVVQAVEAGEVDRGVLAVANSGSGAYVSSLHVISQSRFDVVAVYGMEILQCLIVHPSVKSIGDIKEVFGHPQAISQCKRTFEEKYPDLSLRYGQDSDDTALCVKRIATGDLPITTATMASQVAAQLYKMKIIEYGMHHDLYNTTTFLVIKKSP